MTPAEERSELPRFVRLFLIPLAGVLLVLFFVYRGFPYEHLRARVESELSRATGARISVGSIEPSLALAGPGLAATGVRATSPEGEALEVERVFLRPAWSLSWLRATPAVYVDATAAFGSAAGTYTAGDPPAWSGDLRQVDLAQLPTAGRLRGSGLEGRLDATIDVRLARGGPEGSVQIESHDGSLTLPDLPLPVPYQQLSGQLLLGGDDFVRVESLEFQGELVSGTVTGRVTRGRDFWSSPMDLDVRISADPSLREPLAALGARVARNGSARLRVTGTPAQPRVR